MRPRIGITTSRESNVDRYVAYVEAAGGEAIVLRPGTPTSLEQLDGLLLSGGVDVHPRHYGQVPDPTVLIDEERVEALRRVHVFSDLPEELIAAASAQPQQAAAASGGVPDGLTARLNSPNSQVSWTWPSTPISAGYGRRRSVMKARSGTTGCTSSMA